jgi:hypothetical protein
MAEVVNDPDVRIRLTLRPLPSEIPVGVRLRKLMKALLRSYGFRCEDFEIPAESEPLKQPVDGDA